jgi:hypothetical protein
VRDYHRDADSRTREPAVAEAALPRPVVARSFVALLLHARNTHVPRTRFLLDLKRNR